MGITRLRVGFVKSSQGFSQDFISLRLENLAIGNSLRREGSFSRAFIRLSRKPRSYLPRSTLHKTHNFHSSVGDSSELAAACKTCDKLEALLGITKALKPYSSSTGAPPRNCTIKQRGIHCTRTWPHHISRGVFPSAVDSYPLFS